MQPIRILSVALLSISALGCHRSDEGNAPSKGEIAVAPLSVPRGLLVARGLGRISGLSQTNSLEALRCNHKRGFRWFDVDLAVTSDGELVCFRRGDEKRAGLPHRVSDLTAKEVEAVSYAGQFPITRVSALLQEADRLGDVVLVADTGRWSKGIEQAMSRTFAYGPKHATRIVLQAYSLKDLPKVASLSKAIGAGLLLNVNQTDASGEKIADAAQKHPLLGVVANKERFTPWLAERLHAAHIPILVNTINEHRELVSFARAGADGFYTDAYVPFGTFTADPTAAMECGKTKPTSEQLGPWTQRNSSRDADYVLLSCAKRKSDRIELTNCDDRAAIHGNALAVPAGETLHVEVDAEAGPAGAEFWVDLIHDYKKGRKPARPRESVRLKPNERREMKYEVQLPDGSPGVEVRLGLSSRKDTLVVHHLNLFHGSATKTEEPVGGSEEAQEQEPSTTEDAGE